MGFINESIYSLCLREDPPWEVGQESITEWVDCADDCGSWFNTYCIKHSDANVQGFVCCVYSGGTVKANQKINLGLGDHLGSTDNVSWTLSVLSGIQSLAAFLYTYLSPLIAGFGSLSLCSKIWVITSGWQWLGSPVKLVKFEERYMFVEPLGINLCHWKVMLC